MNALCRVGLPVLALGLVVAAASCGTRRVVSGMDEFVSVEYGFSIAVPADMANAGWVIVHAGDATVRDAFVPPDSSSWEPVAVVAPPSGSFPLLAPFFVNVFTPRDPSVAATALADMRAARFPDIVVSRRSHEVHGVTVAEIIFGSGDDRVYESFLVADGLGYTVRTSGAPLSSSTAQSFFVDTFAYARIVSSFRLVSSE